MTKVMNCTICKKPIVLVPSAAERAKHFGGTPSFYTRLFTTHAACVLSRRDGIECPQCPVARSKGVQCKADYHDGGIPMKYPKGRP